MKLVIIETKEGIIFIPVESPLGKYYLQFTKRAGFKIFAVWRKADRTIKPAETDHYIGEISKDYLIPQDSGLLPFTDIKVMMEMAKKL